MAKDAANNTFSALEGLPFHWTVPSATPALATEPGSKSDAMCVPRSTTSCSVVTPLLLSSTSMKVTDIRRVMEDDGVETDQIALATADMHPGSATVEAKPNNDTGLWKQDPTIHLHAIKRMYVVKRLVVDPEGRSAVVINSCFAYQLLTMRKCRNESKLVYTSPRTPHERFEWSSTNEGVALVDKKYGAVTARALGEAEITVNHRSNHNNAEYDGIYRARVKVQVVEAGMIDLAVDDKSSAAEDHSAHEKQTADGIRRQRFVVGDHVEAASVQHGLKSGAVVKKLKRGMATLLWDDDTDGVTAQVAVSELTRWLHLVKGRKYHFSSRLYHRADPTLLCVAEELDQGVCSPARNQIWIAENIAVTPTLGIHDEGSWTEMQHDHHSLNGTFNQPGRSFSISVSFTPPLACHHGSQTAEKQVYSGVENQHYAEGDSLASWQDGDAPLQFSMRIDVEDEVEIKQDGGESAKGLILPVSHHDSHHSTHTLFGTGGSGKFNWTSTDSTVVTVTQDGVVSVVSEGNATVICSDFFNYMNHDKLNIVVSLPVKIEFTRSVREVSNNDTLHVGLVIKDGLGRSFDSCNFIDSGILSVSDPQLFAVESHPEIAALASKRLLGRASADKSEDRGDWPCILITLQSNPQGLPEVQGDCKVSVSWSLNDYSATIERSVGVFLPLRLVKPSSDRVVAALGCPVNVMYAGGPRWSFTQDSRVQFLLSDGTWRDWDPETFIVKIVPGAPPTNTVYVATCVEFGQQTIQIQIENTLTTEEKLEYWPTAVSKQNISFLCAEPKSIELAPYGKHTLGAKSVRRNDDVWQQNQDVQALRVCSNHKHDFRAVMYTEDSYGGESFTCSSSVALKWSVDWGGSAGESHAESKRAEILANDVLFDASQTDSHFGRQSPDEIDQYTWGRMFLALGSGEDFVAASVETVGYEQWASENIEIGILTGSLTVWPLPVVVLDRSSLTLLNSYHPENVQAVETSGGSSLFRVSSDARLGLTGYVPPLDIKPPWARKPINVSLQDLPGASRNCSDTFTVHVKDIGLVCGYDDHSVTFEVGVSPLAALSIDPYIEFELGSSMHSLSTRGTYNNGEALESGQLKLLELSYSADNETTLSVRGTATGTSGNFVIRPNCLGKSTLSVQTSLPNTWGECNPDVGTISATATVQVHAKLDCAPLVLVPGAVVAVMCSGGPSGKRVFSIAGASNSPIATVIDGVIHGGPLPADVDRMTTKLLVNTGKQTSYASTVEVIALHEVQIASSMDSNFLHQGSTSRISVQNPLGGHGPQVFAGAPMNCTWTTGNGNVFEILEDTETCPSPVPTGGLIAFGIAKESGESQVTVVCDYRPHLTQTFTKTFSNSIMIRGIFHHDPCHKFCHHSHHHLLSSSESYPCIFNVRMYVVAVPKR
jgi:hypothetical protein